MIGQNIQVKRMHRLDNADSKLKAFADIAIEGVVLIKGLSIVDGKNGLFVGMPREQGKDGRWYQNVLPLNEKVKQQINQIVLQAYEEQ